jgi:hypothetical protein
MTMQKINKRALYESIMKNVAKEVKKYLNESYGDERFENCETAEWPWDRLEEFLITLDVTPEDVNTFTKYNDNHVITEVAFTVTDPDFQLGGRDGFMEKVDYLSCGDVNGKECLVNWYNGGNGLKTIILEVVGDRTTNYRTDYHILGNSYEVEYIVGALNNNDEIELQAQTPLADELKGKAFLN